MFIAERFVGFPPDGAAAVMSALRTALENCDETAAERNGTRVTWRVMVVPSSVSADEAVPVRLTTDDAGQGRPVTTEQTIFRRGEFVLGMAQASEGDVDSVITVRPVEAADRKLFMLDGG